MYETDLFRRQQEEIITVAGELIPYLRDVRLLMDESREVRRILTAMLGKLNLHLDWEDRSLYPRMLGSEDTQVRMTAKRLQFEMCGFGEALLAHNASWSAAAIAEDPAGFSLETRRMLGALGKRIKAENAQLYPLLEKAA